MNQSEWKLLKLRLAMLKRAFIFVAIAVIVFLVLPKDTPDRVRNEWHRFVDYMKREHGPFYAFFSNTDMDNVAKEYGQFKTRPDRKK